MAPPFSSSNYKTSIINSSHIIDRGIKGIDIELGTIELNNLSAAAIASLSGGGGGGLTANSVNSSHIINGSILAEDISNNTITGSKIAIGTITSSNILDGTILGTDIDNKTITAANIADQTITKYQIADGSITGTQINSSTITESNIADGSITDAKIATGTITYNSLNSSLIKAINGQIGVFEIRNAGGSNVDFTIDFQIVSPQVDIFLNEYVVNNGASNFLSYLIPNNFTELTFLITTSCTIASFVSNHGGSANETQVGAGKISFEIKRGQQNYLQFTITPA
jgi:hypothetical protein